MSFSQRRCILILTWGRTGSSALAGALHKMGIPMFSPGFAESMTESRDYAKAGLYEDGTFWQINFDVWQKNLSEVDIAANYGLMVLQRRDVAIWGLKDPQAIHTFEKFYPLLPDPHLIVSTRDMDKSVASFLHAFGGGEYLARINRGVDEETFVRDLLAERQRLLGDILSKHGNLPSLVVAYEDLLDDPIGWMGTIAAFVFNGVPYIPHPERFSAAVQHIDPDLKTF